MGLYGELKVIVSAHSQLMDCTSYCPPDVPGEGELIDGAQRWDFSEITELRKKNTLNKTKKS